MSLFSRFSRSKGLLLGTEKGAGAPSAPYARSCGGELRGTTCSIELRQSPQVERRCRHEELPAYFQQSSEPGLAHSAGLLHPPECLFDQRPFALADRIARMPGRARVDRAPAGALHILGYVRPNIHLPQDAHEIPRVVRLIGTQRHRPAVAVSALALISPMRQDHRGVAFGHAISL